MTKKEKIKVLSSAIFEMVVQDDLQAVLAEACDTALEEGYDVSEVRALINNNVPALEIAASLVWKDIEERAVAIARSAQ